MGNKVVFFITVFLKVTTTKNHWSIILFLKGTYFVNFPFSSFRISSTFIKEKKIQKGIKTLHQFLIFPVRNLVLLQAIFKTV